MSSLLSLELLSLFIRINFRLELSSRPSRSFAKLCSFRSCNCLEFTTLSFRILSNTLSRFIVKGSSFLFILFVSVFEGFSG